MWFFFDETDKAYERWEDIADKIGKKASDFPEVRGEENFRDIILVGQTDEYPQHVGHFFSEIGFFAWFEALVAVLSCNDSSQFSYLLCEASHVGEFTEIAHTVFLDPLVYSQLCFFDGHNVVRAISSMMIRVCKTFMKSKKNLTFAVFFCREPFRSLFRSYQEMVFLKNQSNGSISTIL